MAEITPGKMLQLVYKDCVKRGLCRNTTEFAKLIHIDQSMYSRMSRGEKQVTYGVVKAICYELGYSPAWVINYEGDKMAGRQDIKLITEIQMLRTEMDIMANFIKRSEAREKATTTEINELKNRIKALEFQFGRT